MSVDWMPVDKKICFHLIFRKVDDEEKSFFKSAAGFGLEDFDGANGRLGHVQDPRHHGGGVRGLWRNTEALKNKSGKTTL